MKITDKPFYRHSATGLEHLEAGRLQDAVISYGLAAEADPRLSDPHRWAGVASWCIGDARSAVDSWAIAITKSYQGWMVEPLLLFFASLRSPATYDAFDAFEVLKERILHRRTTKIDKMLGAVLLDESDEAQLWASIETIESKQSPRAVGEPGRRKDGAKTMAEFVLGIRALMAGDLKSYQNRMRLCWERKRPRHLECYLAGYEAGLFPPSEAVRSDS